MKQNQIKTNRKSGARRAATSIPRSGMASAYLQLRSDFDELMLVNSVLRDELRRERNLVAILVKESRRPTIK